MLRVVTYNIRAAIGPGPFPPTWWRQVDRERLERLGQVVAALEPDVVALEEVALSTIDGVVLDMAAELSRLTGLESRYGAVGHFPIVDPDSGDRIGASFWGNALLSRLPIQSSRTIGLPTAADDELVSPSTATWTWQELPTARRPPAPARRAASSVARWTGKRSYPSICSPLT
ncbi:MAG: hypothetical protein H0X16_10450 [Chloroflexi bacterium]|nr:hypothetical protein [Chloroflexota bacterium]